MSLDPGLVAMVTPAPGSLVDWSAYRACGVCSAGPGSPCTSMFDRVSEGRPVGGPRVLPVAHGHRKRRSGR